MFQRLKTIYQKFGFYESIRICFGVAIMLALPAILCWGKGLLAIWVFPLVLIFARIGTRHGREAYQDVEGSKSLINWAIRISAISMAIAGISYEEFWPLTAVTASAIAYATTTLYWSLSDPRIVNLDRVPNDNEVT